MATPKAVIFDLDETLLIGEAAAIQSFMDICREAEDYCEVKADALYQAIRQHSRHLWHNSPHRQFLLSLGIASFEGLCSTFEGNYPNFTSFREWAPQFRHESWLNALKECGIDDGRLASRLADAYLGNRRRHQALFDDAGTCLETLSKLYPLALLTNGAPDLQHEKVATTGIGKYFKTIAVSGEVGYGKPDRRFFELVLSRLEVDAAHTWMVGDSLEWDVAGAQVLGMNTVWVNRDDIRHDQTVNPDIEVSGLDLLTAIIG
jgi:putative hydrolase of the HAD superfamily